MSEHVQSCAIAGVAAKQPRISFAGILGLRRSPRTLGQTIPERSRSAQSRLRTKANAGTPPTAQGQPRCLSVSALRKAAICAIWRSSRVRPSWYSAICRTAASSVATWPLWK